MKSVSVPRRADCVHLMAFACGAVLALGTAEQAAAQQGQLGRGFDSFDWRTRGAYEFGFQPLFDVVLVNDSSETMYFEAASFTTAVQHPQRAGHAWEVPPGQIGRPEIFARRIDAGFRTEGGRYVLVEPQFTRIGGRNVALFRVTDDDIARTNKPTATEADRAEAFRTQMEANMAGAASRVAQFRTEPEPGDEPAKFEQSKYRLVVDESLTRDVRNWLRIRGDR